MSLVYVIVVFIAVIVAMKFLKSGKSEEVKADSAPIKVNAKTYFFSKAESSFYKALLPIAADLNLTVCPKVGLVDLFDDAQGAARHQANRYKQKHIDFLILKGPNFQPVAGIELDGKSHQSVKQMGRDQVKDEVFRAAKLPLLRFQNQDLYDQSDIRRQLEVALSGKQKV